MVPNVLHLQICNDMRMRKWQFSLWREIPKKKTCFPSYWFYNNPNHLKPYDCIVMNRLQFKYEKIKITLKQLWFSDISELFIYYSLLIFVISILSFNFKVLVILVRGFDIFISFLFFFSFFPSKNVHFISITEEFNDNTVTKPLNGFRRFENIVDKSHGQLLRFFYAVFRGWQSRSPFTFIAWTFHQTFFLKECHTGLERHENQ